MRYLPVILFLAASTAFFFLGHPVTAQAVTCPSGMTEKSGVCFPTDTGLSDKPVMDLAKSLLDWLFGIFGFLAVGAFVISGIQYLTAFGEEKAAETAKRNMKYAVIGIVVALSGFIIVQAINSALKGSTTF